MSPISNNKNKYLLKYYLIHKQRFIIEEKIKELGLNPNFDYQRCLIEERNHLEFYEYYIDENKKIHKRYCHILKNQIDYSHFLVCESDLNEINEENGIYIIID